VKQRHIELILVFIFGAVFGVSYYIIDHHDSNEFCLPYSSGRGLMNFGQTNVPYCYDTAFDNSTTCWVWDWEPIPFANSTTLESGNLTLVVKGSHTRLLTARVIIQQP
jgi:hypothetical protein